MDHMNKPALRKGMLWLKIVLIAACAIWGAAMMIFAVTECQRYNSVKDRAVPVTAVISRVEEDYDDDTGVEYDIYISYTYKGEYYSDLLGTSSSRRSYNRIGEEVDIQINPDQPWEQVKGISSGSVAFMIFGSCLLVCGVMLLSIRHRRSYVEENGLCSLAIRADLKIKICHRYGWIAFLLGAVANIFFCVYAWEMLNVTVCAVFGGIFAIIGILLWVPYRKRVLRLRDENHICVEQTVKDKRQYRDNEGDAVYELSLLSGGTIIGRKVTPARYQMIALGSVIYKITCCETQLEYYFASEQGRWQRF